MTFLICGVDEVGRGALAGPLVAVAALFRQELDAPPVSRLHQLETDKSPILGVDDSKNLTPKKRREVFHRILRSSQIVDFGIGEVSVAEINEVGIDWANAWAFQRAMQDLDGYVPHFTLVDGTSPIMGWDFKSQRNEPKADGKWWPVGAASILAKVIRDSFMAELSQDHPYYGWEKNAGYGSEEHRCGLIDFGATPLHREKFIRNIPGVDK